MKLNKIKREIVIDLVALGIITLVFLTLHKFTQETESVKNIVDDVQITSTP